MAITLVKANGTVIKYDTDKKLSLEDAQSLVGGYVDSLNWPNNSLQMLVNSDLVMGEVNAQATNLTGQLIIGDVVILTGDSKW